MIAREVLRNQNRKATLAPDLLRKLDADWRAANYLSVGQIYLYDNPLLKGPLTLDHIRTALARALGHDAGSELIYAHLNRIIKERDLSVIYVTGPGHGGPGIVANTYSRGTYSEVYPEISQDAEGMSRLFKQFSSPAAFRVTWHRRHRSIHEVASSATRFRMLTEPPLTIPRSAPSLA